MDTTKVKELMVPVAKYATVNEDATLFDAVLALEKSQAFSAENKDPHRAVLVINKHGHVLGKIGQIEVLKALEPNYHKLPENGPAVRMGFSHRFLEKVAQNYGLWQKPMEQICKKASEINVKSVMYAPATESEYIHEEAGLDDAIHRLVMGRHASLLVIRRGRITGILRLTDVYGFAASRMKACGL
jgi:predicted transcriptional regulator